MKIQGYPTVRGIKILVLLIATTLGMVSCGGAKKKRRKATRVTVTSKNRKSKTTTKTKIVTTTKPRRTQKETKNNSTTAVRKKIRAIVQHAKAFEGTRYQYGGTTKRGMDCSGLVYTAFQKEAIALPRTSRAMATKGIAISRKKVAVGDLLFFKTGRTKKNINHVGIVVSVANEIRFIHASVSKGVTVSSLNERYWNACYTTAKRVL